MANKYGQGEFDLYDLEDNSLQRLLREGNREMGRRERERKLQQRGFGVPNARFSRRNKGRAERFAVLRDWCEFKFGADAPSASAVDLVQHVVIDVFRVPKHLRDYVKHQCRQYWRRGQEDFDAAWHAGNPDAADYYLSIMYYETNVFDKAFDPELEQRGMFDPPSPSLPLIGQDDRSLF